MPVRCLLLSGKWRIVEPGGQIAKTENGKARDGGGHESRTMCERQARAINDSLKKDTKTNKVK